MEENMKTVQDMFGAYFKRYTAEGAGGIVVSVCEQSSLMNSAIGARICRTSKPLEELVNGEMSGDWHDMVNRILIQFGDRSVGELNSFFLIFEGLSIYDACYLTNRRLTSLLQESTRAVDMDNVAFEGDVSKSRRWIDFYRKCKPLFKRWIKARFPRAEGVELDAYLTAVKYLAFDYCREFLPLGIHTRVALVLNARSLIACIHKWGNKLCPPAIQMVSTILKKMVDERMPYLKEALDPSRNPKPWFTPLFVHSDESAFTYESTNNKADLISEGVDSNIPNAVYYDEQQNAITSVEALLALRTNRFCDLPKIMEHSHFSVIFRSMMFGDARDFWRHRMLTPSCVTLYYDKPSRPTVFVHNLGPPEEAIPLEHEYIAIWKSMDYSAMPAWVRCYLLPMCTRVSFSWSLNLRSLVGILELRTTSNTHHNVREVAHKIARQLQVPGVFPSGKGIYIDFATYDLGRLESERRLAEKKRKAEAEHQAKLTLL